MKALISTLFLISSTILLSQSDRTARWISKHKIKSISINNGHYHRNARITYTFSPQGHVVQFQALDTINAILLTDRYFEHQKITKEIHKNHHLGRVTDSTYISIQYDQDFQKCIAYSSDAYWLASTNDNELKREERSVFQGAYSDSVVHFNFTFEDDMRIKEQLSSTRWNSSDSLTLIDHLNQDTITLLYSSVPPSETYSRLNSYHYLERLSEGMIFSEFYPLSDLKRLIKKEESLKLEYY